MLNRLRVARAEHRLTQVELAYKARISPNRLWRIENGVTDPTPEERSRLSHLLQVPELSLFPGLVASTSEVSA